MAKVEGAQGYRIGKTGRGRENAKHGQMMDDVKEETSRRVEKLFRGSRAMAVGSTPGNCSTRSVLAGPPPIQNASN